ncbi:MAG: hypothetical protein ACOX87_13975 [Chloroflexota bacterium]|jgi:predicted transcriptional regulator
MGASTIRMNDDLHERLNAWAREEGRSFNELAVEVLERELRRHEQRVAIDRLIEFGKRMREKYGVMPGDSTEEIRELREERAARG